MVQIPNYASAWALIDSPDGTYLANWQPRWKINHLLDICLRLKSNGWKFYQVCAFNVISNFNFKTIHEISNRSYALIGGRSWKYHKFSFCSSSACQAMIYFIILRARLQLIINGFLQKGGFTRRSFCGCNALLRFFSIYKE